MRCFQQPKKSLSQISENHTKQCMEKPWNVLFQCEKQVLQDDYRRGKFSNLCAVKNEIGSFVAGARFGAAVPFSNQSVLSKLIVRDAHNQGLLGVAATTGKVRAAARVINLTTLLKKTRK